MDIVFMFLLLAIAVRLLYVEHHFKKVINKQQETNERLDLIINLLKSANKDVGKG